LALGGGGRVRKCRLSPAEAFMRARGACHCRPRLLRTACVIALMPSAPGITCHQTACIKVPHNASQAASRHDCRACRRQIEDAVERDPAYAAQLAAADAAGAAGGKAGKSRWRAGLRTALSKSGGLFTRLGDNDAAGHAVYRLGDRQGAADLIAAWNAGAARVPGRQALPAAPPV